jgi:ubiquitin-conjugating enzyme E2 variant
MISWIGFIVVSWLVADFVAGAFHWFEDRYLDQNTPILGKFIGGPNKYHHKFPTGFLQGSYWGRNSTTILPSLAALVLCLVFEALRDGWLFCLFISQANQIHAWAHSKGKTNCAVEMLQSTGIFQSPKHHADHHRSPFEIKYCVMSDLLNPFLDTIQFWRGCEAVLWCFGIRRLNDG